MRNFLTLYALAVAWMLIWAAVQVAPGGLLAVFLAAFVAGLVPLAAGMVALWTSKRLGWAVLVTSLFGFMAIAGQTHLLAS